MRSKNCGRAKITSVSLCFNSSKSALFAAIRCTPKSLKFVLFKESDSGEEI